MIWHTVYNLIDLAWSFDSFATVNQSCSFLDANFNIFQKLFEMSSTTRSHWMTVWYNSHHLLPVILWSMSYRTVKWISNFHLLHFFNLSHSNPLKTVAGS